MPRALEHVGSRRWDYQPDRGLCLPDRTHPLCPDHAWLFNELDGGGNRLFDLVGDLQLAVTKGPSTTDEPFELGGGLPTRGIKWDGGGASHAESVDTGNLLPSFADRDFSVFTWYRSASNKSNQTLFHKQHATNYGPILAINRDSGTNGSYSIFHGGAWVDSSSGTGISVTDGIGRILGATYRHGPSTSDARIALYRDGLRDHVVTGTRTSFAGSNDALRLGCAGFSAAWDVAGWQANTLVYFRELQDEEVYALTLDPFGWLRAPELQRYYSFPVAGGNEDKTAPDTGSGADAGSVAAQITGAETGVGADAGAVAAQASAADTGAGADAGQIGTSTGDTGAGADAGAVTAALSTAETGVGADAGAVAAAVQGSETGAGLDAAAAEVGGTAGDTGGGGDTGTSGAAVTAAETGSGADTGTQQAIGSDHTAAETGAALDAGAVAAQLAAADTGGGADAGAQAVPGATLCYTGTLTRGAKPTALLTLALGLSALLTRSAKPYATLHGCRDPLQSLPEVATGVDAAAVAASVIAAETGAGRDALAFDTFTRADAGALGNAESGQAWIALAGTAEVLSGRARGSANSFHVLDAGAADVAVSVTLSVPGAPSGNEGLVIRATDFDNLFYAVTGAGSINLYRRQGGGTTLLGFASYTPVAGDRLLVLAVGDSLGIYANNVIKLSVTSTFNQSATKHGMWFGGTDVRLDNWETDRR